MKVAGVEEGSTRKEVGESGRRAKKRRRERETRERREMEASARKKKQISLALPLVWFFLIVASLAGKHRWGVKMIELVGCNFAR